MSWFKFHLGQSTEVLLGHKKFYFIEGLITWPLFSISHLDPEIVNVLNLLSVQFRNVEYLCMVRISEVFFALREPIFMKLKSLFISHGFPFEVGFKQNVSY